MSSLRQSHTIFRIVVKKLQERAKRSSSCSAVLKKKKKHARSFHQYQHSRIMRVILAQGSCPMLQILDVSSQRKNRGPRYSSSKKQQYVRVILAQKPCKISLLKKKNVQLTPCRRENRHSCEGSPILCGRLFRDFGRSRGFQRFAPQKHYGRPLRL